MEAKISHQGSVGNLSTVPSHPRYHVLCRQDDEFVLSMQFRSWWQPWAALVHWCQHLYFKTWLPEFLFPLISFLSFSSGCWTTAHLAPEFEVLYKWNIGGYFNRLTHSREATIHCSYLHRTRIWVRCSSWELREWLLQPFVNLTSQASVLRKWIHLTHENFPTGF